MEAFNRPTTIALRLAGCLALCGLAPAQQEVIRLPAWVGPDAAPVPALIHISEPTRPY